MNFNIKEYNKDNENDLFRLIEKEGEDWSCYWKNKLKYKKAIQNSITYVLYEKETLCGFVRCRNDDGFGIYIYDLLVDLDCRGKGYGKLLMEKVYDSFPNEIVYVMSGVDLYYEKLGYEKEGTIYIVNKK